MFNPARAGELKFSSLRGLMLRSRGGGREGGGARFIKSEGMIMEALVQFTWNG